MTTSNSKRPTAMSLISLIAILAASMQPAPVAASDAAPTSAPANATNNEPPAAPTAAAAEESPATSPAPAMDLLVVDQASKDPLPGMTIITAGGAIPRINATTGPDGHIRIPLPKSDKYPYFNIAVRGPGYVNKCLRWFPQSQTMNGTPPTARTLEMESVATISGIIIDPKGNPVPRASVTLVFDKDYTDPHEQLDIGGSEGFSIVKADAAGAFSFKTAPADCKSISVGASGEHHIALPATEFTPLSALRDGTASITLTPGVSVAGTVTDDDGNPVPKVYVTVQDPTIQTYPPPTVRTDNAGKFAFAFKPDTKISLFAYLRGYSSAQQAVTVGTDDQQITIKLSRTAPTP